MPSNMIKSTNNSEYSKYQQIPLFAYTFHIFYHSCTSYTSHSLSCSSHYLSYHLSCYLPCCLSHYLSYCLSAYPTTWSPVYPTVFLTVPLLLPPLLLLALLLLQPLDLLLLLLVLLVLLLVLLPTIMLVPLLVLLLVLLPAIMLIPLLLSPLLLSPLLFVLHSYHYSHHVATALFTTFPTIALTTATAIVLCLFRVQLLSGLHALIVGMGIVKLLYQSLYGRYAIGVANMSMSTMVCIWQRPMTRMALLVVVVAMVKVALGNFQISKSGWQSGITSMRRCQAQELQGMERGTVRVSISKEKIVLWKDKNEEEDTDCLVNIEEGQHYKSSMVLYICVYNYEWVCTQ